MKLAHPTSRLTKMLGVLAGAGTMSAGLAVQAPAATATGPTGPITKVVILLQENHSFNNVLGPLCARSAGRCAGRDVGSRITMSDGTVIRISQATDIVPNVDHSPKAQVLAAGNDWDHIKGCTSSSHACISAFTPDQIPSLARLAGKYAISDATTTCHNVPSWADHFEVVDACDLGGFRGTNPQPLAGVPSFAGWGLESHKVSPWRSGNSGAYANVPSGFPDYTIPGLVNGGAFKPTPVAPMRTFMDNCDAITGCSWGIYGTQPEWSICPSFAQCLYTSQRNNTHATDQFLADAAAGTLPSVSWVTPSFSGPDTSQHNAFSMLAGDNAIGKAVSTLMNGPDWLHTAVFITYDDCGCFYDPQGPGRVPMVIVSPWAKVGYTDHTPTTFAGLLHFAEEVTGAVALNPLDATAYPFTNSFDFTQAPRSGVTLRFSPLSAASLNASAHAPASTANDPS